MIEKNTIAIWCEKAENAPETGVEFHINLWHFSKPFNLRRFFDIVKFWRHREAEGRDFFELGIMPDDPDHIECIKIFLPIQVTHKEIEDLGPKFRNTEIAEGIFNERLSCTQHADNKSVELKEGNVVFCRVHIFSTDGERIGERELSLKPLSDGTLLTITDQALKSLGKQSSQSKKGYFRLRIRPSAEPAPPFFTAIEPEDRAWKSGFEVIEYIDCRVNEARTVPSAVEEELRMAKNGVAETKLIAFLAVVPVVSSITSSHAEWHKSRLLERQIWKSYVPKGLKEDMVVYHWKKCFEEAEASRFSGFSAFVKMQTRRSGALIICFFALLVFFLSVIGSLTASWFQHLIFGSG